MKITHTDTEITFTFPRFAKRTNAYDEDGEYGEYPVFTGLIVRYEKKGSYCEMGFAFTIDMTYAGKPDQVSDFAVRWYESEEEFRKKCGELGIGIYEMTL